MLHTRIPESLDRHIRRRARSVGVSVSTVVRNVLLNTFGLVEDIVADSANIAASIIGDGRERGDDGAVKRKRPPLEVAAGSSDILAWQEAVLNRSAACDRCDAVLRKGARAAIAVREGAGPRVILCKACLEKIEGGPKVRALHSARGHEPAASGRREKR